MQDMQVQKASEYFTITLCYKKIEADFKSFKTDEFYNMAK